MGESSAGLCGVSASDYSSASDESPENALAGMTVRSFS